MRKARMFHGIDRSQLYVPLFGFRLRPLAFGVCITSALVMVVLMRAVSPAAGVTVALLGVAVALGGSIYLSFLDPDHLLSELTQLRLLWSGFRNRYDDADDGHGDV